jgi:hypothetical protein
MERGSQEGFNPYFFGDKGYLLLPWIMTPHEEGQQHFVLEMLLTKNINMDNMS